MAIVEQNSEIDPVSQTAPCGRELVNPGRECEQEVLERNHVRRGSVYCGGCASRIVYGSLDATALPTETNN